MSSAAAPASPSWPAWVLHGKADEAFFREGLALIEGCATDERNFVKKGVNWALRAI